MRQNLNLQDEAQLIDVSKILIFKEASKHIFSFSYTCNYLHIYVCRYVLVCINLQYVHLQVAPLRRIAPKGKRSK